MIRHHRVRVDGNGATLSNLADPILNPLPAVLEVPSADLIATT